MKQLIIILALFNATACIAQVDINSNYQLYTFEPGAVPKDITRLGTDPEFPFLRNIETAREFVAVLKSRKGQSKADLERILVNIGFEHGIADVTESNVSQAQVSPGTIGNMGEGGAHHYVYSRLENSIADLAAWKITTDNGSAVYFMDKCGNAFYPEPASMERVSDNSSIFREPEEILPVDKPSVSEPTAKEEKCGCRKHFCCGDRYEESPHGWDVYAEPGSDAGCCKTAHKEREHYMDCCRTRR